MKADRVLVPLDGSPLAERALPKALQLLSDSPSATLILLRAAQATSLPGIDPTEAQVAVVREAESYLDAIAARLADRGLTRVVRSVWYSSAAKAIVEAARVRHADVIVMSTHGRSGLGRLVLGSVAESVLRGTRTPILLVSARGDGVEAQHPTAPSVPTNVRPGPAAAVSSFRTFGVLRLAVGSHSLTGQTIGTGVENAKATGVVQAKSSPTIRRS
jgi:nucleotide-binding universal stress UspA family protein